MLEWHPVVTFPINSDLSPFLRYLHGLCVMARVTEERGQQQLWVSDRSKVLQVAKAAESWVEGNLASEIPEPAATQSTVRYRLILRHLIKRVPVTLSCIALGFIGFLLVMADLSQLRYAEPFLFQPQRYGFVLPLSEGLSKGQYWRLFTPIFLHFSLLHIVFNAVVLWQFGLRIERAKGSLHCLAVVVFTGLMGNVIQYLTQADVPFGGLSGVVYGFVGYVAVYQRYIKHPILQFNESILAGFIVWLLLGVFGIVDLFIHGGVANGAHVGGLVSGALYALWVVINTGKDSAKK